MVIGTENSSDMENIEEGSKGISFFEKYLPIWVALCMVIGVIFSQAIPGISEAINSWQIQGISIPIGICLFLMMYPAMLNLQASELKKLRKNPKPIILTDFIQLGYRSYSRFGNGKSIFNR